MVSSQKLEDYHYLKYPDKWGISETNKEYLQSFINDKRAHGIRLTTLNNYVNRILHWIHDIGLDDMKQVTKSQIQSVFFKYTEAVYEGGHSQATLKFDVITIRSFMKYLLGKDDGLAIADIYAKMPHNNRPASDYVTVEQIKAMRDAAITAGNLRGAALIMVLFGTGCRISELLDAKISDLEIKEFNAVLTVSGKTGSRNIPFVIGLPELMNWLNSHPMKDGKGNIPPDAPIFTTYLTRGNDLKKLDTSTAENYIKRVAKEAGVPEGVKCSPHALRHRLATTVSKQMDVREMNMLFGWSDNTNTALTYIHGDEKELENTVLRLNGVEVPEENKTSLESMFVIQCPVCRSVMPADALICTHCKHILNPVLALKYDQIVKDITEKPEIALDYFAYRVQQKQQKNNVQ